MAKIRNEQVKKLNISEPKENQKTVKVTEKVGIEPTMSKIDLEENGSEAGFEQSGSETSFEQSNSRFATKSTVSEDIDMRRPLPSIPSIETTPEYPEIFKEKPIPIRPIVIKQSGSDVEIESKPRSPARSESSVGVESSPSVAHNKSQLVSSNFVPSIAAIGAFILFVSVYLIKKMRVLEKTHTSGEVKVDYSDKNKLNPDPIKFPGAERRKKKEEKKLELELEVVSPFRIGTPVLLCRNDVDVKKGEIGKIIEILDFDRVLVDFSEPFIFKNKKNKQIVDPEKLASQVQAEALVLIDL